MREVDKHIVMGSSPHTWRILKTFCSLLVSLRIISTYVENTICTHNFKMVSKDHLHIRGEYLQVVIMIKLRKGSSPHTWRIRYCQRQSITHKRIISTYVENTSPFDKTMVYLLGSSPHTWRIH